MNGALDLLLVLATRHPKLHGRLFKKHVLNLKKIIYWAPSDLLYELVSSSKKMRRSNTVRVDPHSILPPPCAWVLGHEDGVSCTTNSIHKPLEEAAPELAVYSFLTLC